MFIFDIWFWIVVGPFLAVAAYCSMRVKSTFLRFQRTPVRTGMTGAQAAAAVARAGGADVTIERVGGFLSDHYDPRTRTLRLSPEVYDGRAISSIAVAAHEAGHAIQHERNYAFLNFRSMMVPVTMFGSQAWFPLFLVGLFINFTGLMYLGVAIFSITVLFQIITLPVEFDASNRAKAVLADTGIVSTEEEAAGVRTVLNAAAMTYVAGALVAIAHLVYYLMLASGSND